MLLGSATKLQNSLFVSSPLIYVLCPLLSESDGLVCAGKGPLLDHGDLIEQI